MERAEVAMAVDSEARGPTTGVPSRGLSGTEGRQAQSEQAWGGAATAAASAQLTMMRGSHGRRGEERPLGHCRQTCSATGGRQSRREDGRLDRLSRCCAASRSGCRWAARMAASGPSLARSAHRRHCQGADEAGAIQ